MSGSSQIPDSRARGEEKQSKPKWKLPSKLPSWLDHFNKHDFKILFRCWVAAWVAMLLIFIHPALHDIGQATFFATLVLFAVPPASILFLYLLAACSLLLGMCLAWAWGLLAMKAALAARPSSETASMVQALQQAAAQRARQTGEPVAWAAQILVHDGFMLDARVTAVYWVMGCAFIYVLGRVRSGNPKLVLMQLFGTIVTNLFLLFGPGLPAYNASLASTLVTPGAVGIALGLACCLLFFPQSSSSVVLGNTQKLILMMEKPVNATKKRFSNEHVPKEELAKTKAGMVGLYKATQAAVGFLPLDFSRCRWGPKDVKSLQNQIRLAMMNCVAVLDVHISWLTAVDKEKRLDLHKAEHASSEDTTTEKHALGHRELTESAHVMDAFRSAEDTAMHEDAMAALKRTMADLLSACSQALQKSANSVHTVNSRRWLRKPPQETFDEIAADLEDTLSLLRLAKEQCVKGTTEGILEAYNDIFGDDGKIKPISDLPAPMMRGIILAMAVEERILTMAESIEGLLAAILHLMKTRKKHRIWVPNQLHYMVSWMLNRKASVPSTGAFSDAEDNPDDAKDPVSLEEDSKEAYHRLRVSRGYANARGRQNLASKVVIGLYKWLFDPAGMFAFRVVAVTIATGIPAVIPHSAGFFYREKGIWAVITAQMCVVVYMADFTFSIFARLVGTIVGGVFGMAAWYIGSGGGPGNPYGLGASVTPFLLILMWFRIYLPPAYTKATILGAATFSLVIGFSYDTRHIVQYGLPGIGYEAFWKRLILVLLGMVAATVVQIFPRPPSATKHICKTLSNSTSTLADHYALLLSHWGRRTQHSPLSAVAEEISIASAETLISLNDMLNVLPFEMTTGPFDSKGLKRVQSHLLPMNQCLRRLLDLSATLPSMFQDRLSQNFGIQDERMIGDIMAVLSVISQSLMTGAPLPERLPTPLVGKFYEYWNTRQTQAMLDRDLVRDDNYRRYCVALASYLRFLSMTDDLVLTMKEIVGECHVVHRWADDV